MNWESIKQPVYAGLIALVSGLAGVGGGAYVAAPAKPVDAATALQKALPQLSIVEGMTGLCIKIDKPAALAAEKPK
jgi:hypothetical protein